MHIPTELILIFLKNAGIEQGKYPGSFSEIELRSCPRCGVCIDVCQMNEAGKTGSTAVYFIRSLREQRIDGDSLLRRVADFGQPLQCGQRA